MILSPPFLPVRHAAASTPADPEAFDNDDDEHDAAYVTTAMDGGVPGAGAYPVSFEMNWHGGMHLTAPKDDQGARLRVRAIADGTVVFRRNPRAKTTTPTDPLNYGGWTDNGCVVIRHDSEIGAAATGAATAVTFYSIYMHLNAIPAEIVVNQPVYRKAEVGTAGSVYGLADSIHFEIVCDSANVKRLTGRSDTYLSVDDDGRADAVFGTMWFFLRTGTPFYAADPTPPTPRRGHPPPHVVPPAQSYTNTEALWVGMTFRRGACIMQTRHLDGRPLGTPIREADYEYKLEARSHERFPGHPSAGFQLLRFGRVLDNADTLTPANAPHWRQVAYDGGSGWVDLNAAPPRTTLPSGQLSFDARVRKFSDADFPSGDAWWMLVDGGASPDSRCKDLAILGLLDANGDLKVSPSEWQSALNDASLQERLSHKICNFPSEWDAATVETRYGWLTKENVTTGPKAGKPRLDAASYAKYKAHVTALCFWDQTKIGIGSTHWHFHPRAFITQFRKCGWMTANELAQLIPRHAAGATIQWSDPSPRNPGAHDRASRFALSLNLMFRKYNLLNATRQVHAVCQLMAETTFTATREGGRGNGHAYEAFYGRGLMQTTWAGAYEAYGVFRQLPDIDANTQYTDTRITHTSTHLWADRGARQRWFPRYDPEFVADDPIAVCDAGGFYWVNKALGGGDQSLSRPADHGVTYQAIGEVSWLINGGFNGFEGRLVFGIYMRRVRGDSTVTTPRETVTFAYRSTYGSGHPVSNHTFTVDHTAQRP